jgi:hypothetical protein
VQTYKRKMSPNGKKITAITIPKTPGGIIDTEQEQY